MEGGRVALLLTIKYELKLQGTFFIREDET